MVTVQSKRVNNILENAESISLNLKNNNETISGILGNLNQVTDDIAKANFKETLGSASKAVSDLQLVVDKINNGNGSIGLLINDEKLYQNLNNASQNLDNLMIDIKANPKRYVSFSVFGGKKD
jgi:phospholipid/cholesterol/gamma-HCH transport system substrate-binding protein